MSKEDANAPGLAFKVVKMVNLMESAVVNNPLSKRWRTSCGVWGSQDKIKVFNTVAIVWCMILHMALDWGFLLVVGTFDIQDKQQAGKDISCKLASIFMDDKYWSGITSQPGLFKFPCPGINWFGANAYKFN